MSSAWSTFLSDGILGGQVMNLREQACDDLCVRRAVAASRVEQPKRDAIMAVLLVAAAALGVMAPGRAAPASDEPAQSRVKLAYDQPLPDSVRRSMVEITVVDGRDEGADCACRGEGSELRRSEVSPVPDRRDGKLRVVYPYSDHPMLNLEVRKEGYIPQRAGWGSSRRRRSTLLCR